MIESGWGSGCHKPFVLDHSIINHYPQRAQLFENSMVSAEVQFLFEFDFNITVGLNFFHTFASLAHRRAKMSL